MKPHAAKVIVVFFVAGVCSAALSLLLGWWYLPLLFLADGLLLFALLAAAFAVCRACGWARPASSRRRYWEAAGLIVIGYPAAEVCGTVMALICEAILLFTPTQWHSAHEPLLWIALLAVWGTVAAAFAVNAAVMVISEAWDNRLLLLLLAAGMLTAAVALAIYAPNYNATEGLAARYRELVLFGVLLPLGNALYSVVAGYGLMRTPAKPSVRLGHQQSRLRVSEP